MNQRPKLLLLRYISARVCINQNLPSETGGGYISWGVHNNMLELTVIRNRFTADNNDLKLIMIDKSPHRKK